MNPYAATGENSEQHEWLKKVNGGGRFANVREVKKIHVVIVCAALLVFEALFSDFHSPIMKR